MKHFINFPRASAWNFFAVFFLFYGLHPKPLEIDRKAAVDSGIKAPSMEPEPNQVVILEGNSMEKWNNSQP